MQPTKKVGNPGLRETVQEQLETPRNRYLVEVGLQGTQGDTRRPRARRREKVPKEDPPIAIWNRTQTWTRNIGWSGGTSPTGPHKNAAPSCH